MNRTLPAGPPDAPAPSQQAPGTQDQSAPGPGTRPAAPSVRSLAWNTILNYASFIFVSLTGFVLTPVLLHHVGDTRMGILTLTTAISSYAAVLDFGLGISTMRAISERAGQAGRTGLCQLVSSVFAVYLLIAAGILVAGLAAVPSAAGLFGIPAGAAGEFRATFILAVLSVSLSFPQAILTAVLNGLRDYAVQNVFVIGYTTVTFGGTLLLLHRGHGIVAVAALTLAAMLAQFAIKAIVVARRHGVVIRPGLMSRRHLAAVRSTAGPVFVVSVAAKVIADTDVVVAGAVLGPAAVAAYQVALSLGTVLRRVGEQLNVIVLTTSAQLHSRGDRRRLATLFLEAYRITALVLAPAAAIIIVVAPQFLRLWVGADMAARSTTTLIVLAVAMTLMALQGTVAQTLIAAGWQKLVAAVAAGEAAGNLVLSVLLARQLGLAGVALGTLIPAVIALTVLSVSAARGLLGIPLSQLGRVLAVPAATSVAFAVPGVAFGRDLLTGLGMIPLIGVCALVFCAWTGAALFGPPASRERYRQVLPWTA